LKYINKSSFYLYLNYTLPILLNKSLQYFNSKNINIYQNVYYNENYIFADILIPQSNLLELNTKIYINLLGLVKKQININSIFNSNILDSKILLTKYKILFKYFNNNTFESNNKYILYNYLPYNAFDKILFVNHFNLIFYNISYLVLLNRIYSIINFKKIIKQKKSSFSFFLMTSKLI
jgi:hypothetical protein